MKTLTFPVRVEFDQKLDQWFETLRKVWNFGLELLIELDSYGAIYKVRENDKNVWKFDAPVCPMPWSYRWIKGYRWVSSVDVEKGEDKDWAAVPYTSIANKKPYRTFCPLKPSTSQVIEFLERNPVARQWLAEEGMNPGDAHYRVRVAPDVHDFYRRPRLENPSNFSLAGFFAQKRHPDWKELREVPAAFVRGMLHSLATAWEKHKKSPKQVGRPKFKRKGDVLGTLVHEDGRQIKVRSQIESVPKRFKVGGISPKEPGKLIQKTVQIPVSYLSIPKLGEIRVPRLLERWGEARIRVIKLCRKPNGYELQLTGDVPVKKSNPKHVAGFALPQKQGILYADDKGNLFEAEPEDLELLARRERLQQVLAQKKYGSSRWKKTKNKIARISQLLAARAKNRNHKLSTFAVRKYQEINIQQVKMGALSKPEPIPVDPMKPHFDANGAGAIAQVNQRRTQLRVGQFVALIQQKAKSSGVKVTVVKPIVDNDQDPARIASSIRPKQMDSPSEVG